MFFGGFCSGVSGNRRTKIVSDLPVRKLSFKPGNFFLELSKEGVFGIFVDSGLVLDVLCSVRVTQSCQRFVIVKAAKSWHVLLIRFILEMTQLI